MASFAVVVVVLLCYFLALLIFMGLFTFVKALFKPPNFIS